MTQSNHKANDFCERVGISQPIIQAPLAGVQGFELAAAVSNEGGLGSLPAAIFTMDQLSNELTQLNEATSQPFNLNFFCHEPPPPNAEDFDRYLELLMPYFAELEVNPKTVVLGQGRMPFNEAGLDLIETFQPKVVSFHFGLPAANLVTRLQAQGCFVVSTATTVDEAQWLQNHRADAIIAQGTEAGGHRGHFLRSDLEGQLPTLDLVAALAATTTLPIIAAGGLGSSTDIAAALSMGASAVQIGTAYLQCDEARTPALHKAALRKPQETSFTNLFSGRPARGILNRLMRELGPMRNDLPAFPLAGSALVSLRAAAEANGSSDFSSLWAGTNYLASTTGSAAEITRNLMHGLFD